MTPPGNSCSVVKCPSAFTGFHKIYLHLRERMDAAWEQGGHAPDIGGRRNVVCRLDDIPFLAADGVFTRDDVAAVRVQVRISDEVVFLFDRFFDQPVQNRLVRDVALLDF